MNSLNSISFDTHSKVVEFFKDLKMPKELAVEFYAELEAFLSAYVSKLIFAAHTPTDIQKFKAYLELKNITDEVKIANMLTLSFEKKTGKKIDSILEDFLENFVKNIDKATAILKKHENEKVEDIDLEKLYQEVIN